MKPITLDLPKNPKGEWLRHALIDSAYPSRCCLPIGFAKSICGMRLRFSWSRKCIA